MKLRVAFLIMVVVLTGGPLAHSDETDAAQFAKKVAPILARRCVSCHNENETEGGLALTTSELFRRGGDSGEVVDTDAPESSLLLQMISGDAPEMPQDADPLSADQVAVIRQWIERGASWPADVTLEEPFANLDWWSLKPLEPPPIPTLDDSGTQWSRTPVDAFIWRQLKSNRLSPTPEADRRTLVRRLYFDLTGLPPAPADVERFVDDTRPDAYERLVDRLLESPHYGERWARHWLDVVHYGDTHGYDKDKPRPNAWPYRDYVIRSLNEDKRYTQFVREQIAGDVLWPGTRDGIEATGFISAGPWDFIGHAEVPEEKLDGQVARNLDRDDMVTSTMNTFMSVTVQCARCHDHKFDPVTQEHYYSLQAVFSALDRADRAYDRDPKVAQRRRELATARQQMEAEKQLTDARIQELAGPRLAELDEAIAKLSSQANGNERPEFGYHSQIEAKQDVLKWVQVDLGKPVSLNRIVLVGSHDTFANIGAGFGFPLRYKVELSNDADFKQETVSIADYTAADLPNPGVTPQTFAFEATAARYIRVTATRLAPRSNDYILALGELSAFTVDGENAALKANVSALDSIEQPVRWQKANLVDGAYFGSSSGISAQLEMLQSERTSLLERTVDADTASRLSELTARLELNTKLNQELPAQDRVYAGTVYSGSGAFRGRGHLSGKPRDIYILVRGEITKRGPQVSPGAIPVLRDAPWQFELAEDHQEGDRRIALADWIVRHDNPLTWRSVVNRAWQYHIGRGIVDSPNDFGRMGQQPTHPELLDWLAIWFRDNGQSMKELHKLIVTSSVYRQSSRRRPEALTADAGNRFLSGMNRRVLEAEAVRDSVLWVSGKLKTKMYGPGFQDFVLERPEHSPHYEYHKHDPDNEMTHRRSVYRFLVRSQQQPFMQTLDCADPSQSVAKRDTSVTAIQALTLMNNSLMVRMAEHFASRLDSLADRPRDRIEIAYQIALARKPTGVELDELTQFEAQYGMANVCRLIFNLNEFVFID